MWMLVLYSLVHYHRTSEAAAYCPSLQDVEPCATAGGVDGDGVPRWITIKYRAWKWRPVSMVGKPYPMQLHRNTYEPRYCPVTQMLLWLDLLRSKGVDIDADGPLFPRMKKNGEFLKAHRREVYEDGRIIWFTDKDEMVNMDEPMVSNIFMRVFRKAKMPKLTPHSFRKSAVQWCARCGGEFIHSMKAGRWQTETEVSTYYDMGAAVAQEYLASAAADPILTMMPYPKYGMTFSGVSGG